MTIQDPSHYDDLGALAYRDHHKKSLRTRLTTWRERALVTAALRIFPTRQRVLDAPCGTGRFWPAIVAAGASELLALDNSAAMLEVAQASWPALRDRPQCTEGSLFALPLPDNHVDVVCCLRFFHHLARSEDRLRAFAELRRVAREGAVVSLWVDGNLQARRRATRPPPAENAGYGPRRVIARSLFEAEATASGFTIARHFDVAPRWSMWRTYALRAT